MINWVLIAKLGIPFGVLIAVVILLVVRSSNVRGQQNTQQTAAGGAGGAQTTPPPPNPNPTACAPTSKSSYVWMVIVSVGLVIAGYFAYQFNDFVLNQAEVEKNERSSGWTERKVRVGDVVEISYDTELIRAKNGFPGTILQLDPGEYEYRWSGGEFSSESCTPVIGDEKCGDIYVMNRGNMIYSGGRFVVSPGSTGVSIGMNSYNKSHVKGEIRLKFKCTG